MVIPDQHGAREVFAEGPNGRRSDHDSRQQQHQTKRTDDIRRRLHAPDAGEAEKHSDRLDEVGGIPELRRMPVPISRRLGSMTTQVRVLEEDP